MNIFVLSLDPAVAAKEHADKHVVKMIVESAQLLSTAHRVLDGTEIVKQKYVNGSCPARFRKERDWELPDIRDQLLYRATHVNHPCSIWCRETTENYKWLWQLLESLCAEYFHRYGQFKRPPAQHKVWTSGLIGDLRGFPKNLPAGSRTPFAQSLPVHFQEEDPVLAYRNYYLGEKRNLLKYTNRDKPRWVK